MEKSKAGGGVGFTSHGRARGQAKQGVEEEVLELVPAEKTAAAAETLHGQTQIMEKVAAVMEALELPSPVNGSTTGAPGLSNQQWNSLLNLLNNQAVSDSLSGKIKNV